MSDTEGAVEPPLARYRLELVIKGNTIDEIVHELQVQTNDFGYDSFAGSTLREQFGGRHHLIVTEPNPEMTPERYDEELQAWARERRTRRA